MVMYQCICVLGVVVWSCTFHNTSQCTITGVCIYSPTDPPPLSLCNFFSTPPFRLSFLSSILYHSSSLSLEWSAKHLQSPTVILHPSSSTYLQSYDIWWGGQGKREEAGGEERKEEEGVGRGMIKCKNMEGREKRKILRVPLRERRRETRGRMGWGLPPPPPLSTLSYLKSRL